MSFGFSKGGSGQQTSQGVGEQFSEGSSTSRGESYAEQRPDKVWGTQQPFLRDLYQRAQAQLGASGGLQDQAQQQFMGAIGQLLNPGISPQLGAYQGDVQRNLERNLLPAIGSAAAGANQLGGSRQGIAEGLAVGEANRDISDMAARLYGEDRNRVLAALQLIPTGLGIPWYGLQQYGGLLGAPTVLGQGGFSRSSNVSESSQSSYGYNTSSSQGTSGGGRGIQLGLGPA